APAAPATNPAANTSSPGQNFAIFENPDDAGNTSAKPGAIGKTATGESANGKTPAAKTKPVPKAKAKQEPKGTPKKNPAESQRTDAGAGEADPVSDSRGANDDDASPAPVSPTNPVPGPEGPGTGKQPALTLEKEDPATGNAAENPTAKNAPGPEIPSDNQDPENARPDNPDTPENDLPVRASSFDREKAAILETLLPGGRSRALGSFEFLRGENRKLFAILMWILPAFSLTLLLLVYFSVFGEPATKYFAVTPELRIRELETANEPGTGVEGLVNWTAETVCGALSLDFLHWRKKLEAIRPDFDPKGFASFLESLQSGGHIKRIEEERLSLSAAMAGAPVIVRQGPARGRMTWDLEIPLAVSYQSSGGVGSTQRFLAKVTVEKVSPKTNPRGMVMKRIVLDRFGQT
ncbi:MAG: DotI/IcmL/TraM family protein, partial [Deltaproteobacteria bacterium]|nr:DotI/IcmL/TraM family protein [Deltaproteobacteria bacterium]